MTQFTNISDIRREYGDLSLDEDLIAIDPIIQFQLWFNEELAIEKNDPTAMVLSTVDDQGHPDSRVVLLKAIDEGTLVFYTNFESAKSQQIENHPYVAINFYWPQKARQVRIRGAIQRVKSEQADEYFLSRPIKSQFSAIISPQSRPIKSRATLENALNNLIDQHGQKPIVRPDYWGGYKVIPDVIEFWQGRDNRLHDRIQYCRQNGKWSYKRLAP